MNMSPGCTCCETNPTLNIKPTGCISGRGLIGATVVLKQSGVTVDTQTSGTGGIAHFHVPLGTYSAVISKTGFTTRTIATITFSTDGQTVTQAMTVATGYICCGATNDPWPNTLYLTDANVSSGSMTYDIDSQLGTYQWNLYEMVSTTGFTRAALGGCVSLTPGSISTENNLYLDCTATGQVRLRQYNRVICCTTAGPAGYAATSAFGSLAITSTRTLTVDPDTGVPLNLVFSTTSYGLVCSLGNPPTATLSNLSGATVTITQ